MKLTLNENPTAAHHLITSLIRTIYPIITKHPQNGSFADSRLRTGKISEPTTVEKMDMCSCVGVGKDPGRKFRGILFDEIYVFDIQERTDPRNTYRFLLSHGKVKRFRVSIKAWTFSGTIRVDLLWDDSEDLAEIARGKYKEAEGASERPYAIEYLSVRCNTLLLIVCSPLEAQQVPVRGFLQTANTSWNSLWEHWLPDFAWRPFAKALA